MKTFYFEGEKSLTSLVQGSREQLAIAEFASALLAIPKTLAVNAAKDSTELVAKLRTYHNAAQNAPVGDPKKALLRYGLDLLDGTVRDNVTAGVLEPTMSKVKSLKSAYEAAVSLLRIDDAIQCVPGKHLMSFKMFRYCGILIAPFYQSNKESPIHTVIRLMLYHDTWMACLM
jgi:chaperonin GroEL (HSP60 family)